MISQINNINFKGFFAPKFVKFSDSQQKVYDDIEAKLGKKVKNHDFFVKPAKNDSVELSEVFGVTETGYGLDSKYSYLSKTYIGRYDENNLFNIEDYKEICRQTQEQSMHPHSLRIPYKETKKEQLTDRCSFQEKVFFVLMGCKQKTI